MVWGVDAQVLKDIKWGPQTTNNLLVFTDAQTGEI